MARPLSKKKKREQAQELLKQALGRLVGEVFLSGDGNFVDSKGNPVSAYFVLQQIAGLRKTVVDISQYFAEEVK